MIKTFEQFVIAKYGKPVNEGFQSSKLREIIKQHGLPKDYLDRKMLYDLQDDEIVGVVNSRDEYMKKYIDEEAFMIELEDGSCLVIGNLGELKPMFSDSKSRNTFKKRHSERHKGNLGEYGGDEIHKKHLEKVDELEQKRFAAEMQPMLSEIAEKIKAKMKEIDSSEIDKEGKFEKEFDIILGDEKYGVRVQYEVEFANYRKSYGAYIYDMICYLTSFEIWDDADGDKYTTNDILGITEKTYGDLFDAINITDVSGGVYDDYEYHGVSRKDFY